MWQNFKKSGKVWW